MRANTEIDTLLAELLESGVSPKYLSRLAVELYEHCDDLEAEARRFGVPDAEIAADARQRLGRCAVIAKEFERRPELRSWINTSRWLRHTLRHILQLVPAAYVLPRTPVRVTAVGHTAMVRYAAAAAAGASVTFCLLLLMATMMSPDRQWSMSLVERAGSVLGPAEAPRLQRTEPDRGPSTPPRAPVETGDASEPTPDAVRAVHGLHAIIFFRLSA